jgi:hypothetical protein
MLEHLAFSLKCVLSEIYRVLVPDSGKTGPCKQFEEQPAHLQEIYLNKELI